MRPRRIRHARSWALVVPLALLASGASAATTATAAQIRNCGEYGYRDSTGRVGWGSSPVNGAGIFNLTTRKVSCRKARRFARHYRGTDTYYPKWHCREYNDYEFSDVRCTARHGRVIHWQTGA